MTKPGLATDRMSDGWEETRLGGFFVACNFILRRRLHFSLPMNASSASSGNPAASSAMPDQPKRS